MDDVQGTVRAAIVLVEGEGLPAADVQNAWSLVDAGEPGVALENLCTQLYEYDVAVSPRAHELLLSAAVTMGVETRYVDILTVRAVDTDQDADSTSP